MFLPLHDENPLKIIPFQFVNVCIITLCVFVFFWQQSLSEQAELYAAYAYGLVPLVFHQQEILPAEINALPTQLTLISYMFLHDDWMHLLGNMLFLWVFGDNIEDAMGHWRFLAFYLLCGIIAGLIHALMDAGSSTAMIGASGSIAGVLGAYLMLHPRVKVLVLLFSRIPIFLPAYLLLGAWIGWQFYSVSNSDDGSVAWWAHIGGFIAGMMLIIPLRDRRFPLFGKGAES